MADFAKIYNTGASRGDIVSGLKGKITAVVKDDE